MGPPNLKLKPLPAGLTLGLALMVSLVALSHHSLWIDEALTAVKAMQPNVHSWWQAMLHERTSDLQMPFYMFYMWAFEKVCGSSEWSLRLANLPWFIAGAVAFIHAFPAQTFRRWIAAFVTLFSPFAWYYLDEARPYAMVLGASLLVAAFLVRLSRTASRSSSPESSDLGWFAFGIVLLSAATMLGMIWAAAALAAVVVILPTNQIVPSVKTHPLLCLGAAATLVALAGYYLWTLKIGARGGAAAPTNLGSMFFVAYELLGFAGLGPGRLAIRTTGLASLRPYSLVLVLYAIAVLALIYAALRPTANRGPGDSRRESSAHPAARKFQGREALAIGLSCVFPPAFIFAAGLFSHWRALGRHFAPLTPAILLVLVSGLSALWSRGRGGRVAALLFCGLMLFSSLSLRYAPRHAKDDYRGASAVAMAALARGQRVWWDAAEEGARYYRVPAGTNAATTAQVRLLMNPFREQLEASPAPDLVVASRPDVYDGQVTLAAYLQARRFWLARELTAFTVWQRTTNQ